MFLKKAIKAGEQEVADAKMHTSDSNASTRYFAKRMIHDHTKADNQLMELAHEDNVSVPSSMPAGPAMSGAQYMHMQVGAHEQAVALFEKEAREGTGQTKVLAAQILPVLKQHLQMAQDFATMGRIPQASSSM